MPFTIIRNDITKMDVDAIVNPANTSLIMGGGACGAIYKAAGEKKLSEVTNQMGPINTSQAVITDGFDLKARHIIHVAGPIYQDGHQNEAQLLKDSYLNSLKLANQQGLRSIAFPLISSGIYGYPKEEALQIAQETILEYLEDYELDVFLVLFDQEAFDVVKQLKQDIQSYIDQHYVESISDLYVARSKNVMMDYQMNREVLSTPLEDPRFSLDISFSEALFRLIDNLNLEDTTVYKRSQLSRKLFSKLKNKDYRPSKKTILALCMGMRLDLEQTEDLLDKAGFSLSNSQLLDVIVSYFIENKNYDIFELNEILYEYDQPLLGS